MAPTVLHGIDFEWESVKAESNFEKHAVTFEEAATAFGDPFANEIDDPDHSDGESRIILIGWTTNGILVVVVYCDRDGKIRIISARRATRREKEDHG